MGVMKLEAHELEETYYTKSDVHQRYPRKAMRIRLGFRYDPEINEVLK